MVSNSDSGFILVNLTGTRCDKKLYILNVSQKRIIIEAGHRLKKGFFLKIDKKIKYGKTQKMSAKL